MCHFLPPVATSAHTSSMETGYFIFLSFLICSWSCSIGLFLDFAVLSASTKLCAWTCEREKGRKWISMHWKKLNQPHRMWRKWNDAGFAYMIFLNYSIIFLLNDQIWYIFFLTVQPHVTKLHSPTEPHKSGWISQLRQLWACGRGFDACPPFFFHCLLCMIRSPRAGTRPLSKHCSPPHHLIVATSPLSFSIFPPLTSISAGETSQCRSCQSRTWGSACWECFWGSCWRCPLTDPTPCRAHPGGSKVTLGYTYYPIRTESSLG